MQYHIPTNDPPERKQVPLHADMIEPLDAIQRSIGNARVIAITSPRAGIATADICQMLCRNVAASGTQTLLVDASQPQPTATRKAAWTPGEPIPETAIEKNVDHNGYDRFMVHSINSTRPLFNNLPLMQQMLQQDLPTYGLIVVHLPPVLDAGSDVVNPVSVARAADITFLACATGQTMVDEATTAAESLKNASVNLAGTILDNTQMQLPGQEMSEYVERMWLLPRSLRRNLANMLRKSTLLNS